MRCNWRRWLWGIIPLLVLSWVAVQAEHGRLERDLAERTRLALNQGGFPWALAEFKGRDVVLTGRAPQEGEPGKAADALAAVWGVRAVDNKAGLLDKAETYLWSARRRNNSIRLTGFAPSIAARQAILGVTRASFPGFEVVDRTTLARGVPSNDVWLAGVSFGLKQLTSIRRGDVQMKDLEIAFTGEAEDIAGYRAVKQAIANSVPKGIKVTADNVTAPVVSPFTWAAQLVDGRFVLSGYVPNDAVRADLVAAANASLPGAAVVDKMEPGEGAPQGWAGVAVASVRELARLEGASVGTKDAVLVVSGTAMDGATAEAIRMALRAALPATIKLTDQIRVKEPPPPQPPPLPPPAAIEAPTKQPEPEVANRIDPPPAPTPPPAPSVQPAPPVDPPAVVKARACEEQLGGLARAGLILFSIGSAELDSVSFQTLDKLAVAAKTCPEMHIEVRGHASSEGSTEINQQLSLKRAQSVVAYLAHAGVDATQLEPVGFGATRPIAPNDSSENMARNRRIEFTVRPK
jgi:outer membrane protein OmpA-like peptidoglycan-associated protein